ncbi:protein FAR1-RELATED SEQUENCE 8-like isoform X2 [Silene latifolia]
MEGTSANSEDLIEEVEDQGGVEGLFAMNDDGEEREDDHHEFGIEDDDHENGCEQFFGVDPGVHGDNDPVLELECVDHGLNRDRLHQTKCLDAESIALPVLHRDTSDLESSQRSDPMCMENYCSPPVEGTEFESYDDAYNYYNSYAREMGFAIRVKSSWTKRNSKEKRGAVLCCNCEGFKTFKEVTSRRKETRTGCLAMIRLRLVESSRWRVDEVKLEHNHLFDPERAQHSKSHKKSDIGAKRPLDPIPDVEIRTIKLYRTPTIDVASSQSLTSRETEKCHELRSCHLKLKAGYSRELLNYFCQKQLRSPNFFYITDLNDEGLVKNMFWIDSRARASYIYFGDVVAMDTTCLLNKYEIPLVAFIGVNHHGRSILLGCALIAEGTVETYVWLFRAWLTCMSGRPPQTIVTDRCKAMESAIIEVFPRAHHRYWLPFVMQNILLNSGPLQQSGPFQSALHRTVYGSLKTEEFESSWDNMIQQFGIQGHEWLQIWYEDRIKWAPVYQKETFLAGLFSFQPSEEPLLPFFAGHVHEQTSMKEFLNLYDDIMKKIRQQEALDDLESSGSNLLLRTRCYYELQLSKFYTKVIFEKFQVEVETMPCCLSINQVRSTGPVITYTVKERENEGIKEFRSFEVMYNKEVSEVRCICGGFHINGYLCRHALSVLSHNCVEEIPFCYILPRWRKDCKRLYVPEFGSDVIDLSNPCQWYEHLHRRAMRIVEAGMVSQDHFMVAWQASLESLNKVRLTDEKHV